MNAQEMKQRTMDFAIRIINLTQALPNSRVGDVIGRQLLRAGTSVGANYRAACRAKSLADFIAKMGIVEEETDESHYWLEIIGKVKLLPTSRLTALMKEAQEILSICIASINTVRGSRRTRRRPTAAPNVGNPQSAIRNPQSQPTGLA
jgi:four helix bundle protein